VEVFAGNGINGPWDMTAFDLGNAAVLFVTNVLNFSPPGATVLRIALALGVDNDTSQPRDFGRTMIGNGFSSRPDPDALVIGPTGLGLGHDGTLYVADTLASRIAAIPNALFRGDSANTGNTVLSGHALNGPLGLAIAPNGDIITVNGGDGNMVEIEPEGTQLAVKMVDVTGAGGGTLFGLAVAPNNNGVYFVNDGNNKLYLLH
jgi:sugar lactone lactonase YvrE